MRATIDNTNPLAYGMPETVDVFFDNNPVFRLAGRRQGEGRKSGGLVLRQRDAG